MANLATAKDRFQSINSLLSLLQSLEGQETVVELRNESAVKGTVLQVDGFMNVTLTNALMYDQDGKELRFEHFFIKARNIRFVQIPDQVNISRAISGQIQKVTGKKTFNMQTTTKAKLARKRHRETLRLMQQDQDGSQPQPGPSSQQLH